MVDQLHGLGFSVMLWVVPFVSLDSLTFRNLEKQGLLLRDGQGEVALRHWWNGISAVLDLSNPAAIAWLTDDLDALVANFGIDGFKFDAGDLRDFRADDKTYSPASRAQQSEGWARVGLRYPFNEYRACWRMGGQPLAQRLHDKPPSWGSHGLGSLIPGMLAQAMTGHAFTCPDMIGGGEIGAASGEKVEDQEFFVRYTQVAALTPMCQFSISPGSVLDAEHLAAVKDALAIRRAHLPLIMALVKNAAETGEPVLRPMAYHASGLDDVTDQFFLGPDMIVAPVLERGTSIRRVELPDGVWATPDGDEAQGPGTVEIPVGLTTLPRFIRVKD